MDEHETRTQKPRWPRGQRFQLSSAGRDAGENYRAAIVASRGEGGRRSFDAAHSDWAARLKLESGDGLYLGELHAGPRTIDELATALDGCGPERGEVRAAVDRLVRLNMMEPVVVP